MQIVQTNKTYHFFTKWGRLGADDKLTNDYKYGEATHHPQARNILCSVHYLWISPESLSLKYHYSALVQSVCCLPCYILCAPDNSHLARTWMPQLVS